MDLWLIIFFLESVFPRLIRRLEIKAAMPPGLSYHSTGAQGIQTGGGMEVEERKSRRKSSKGQLLSQNIHLSSGSHV